MKNEIVNYDILTIPTLEKHKESFIDYLDVDDLTLKAYKVGIKSFMNYLKENNISNPNRNSIIEFRNYLRDNYSSCTINTYMTSVKALFKYLEIKGIYENIAKDIKGAKNSTIPKKEILSIEQMKYIYNNLTDLKEKCLFGLMCTTGLRAIEVSRAKIENIKKHNGDIVLWVQCKKRDSDDEYVKLSNQTLSDILNYIESRTKGYIFVSTSNNNKGGGVSTETLRKTLKGILKRFGLDKNTLSMHSIRRSFAVGCYETGSSIYDIQQVLHHSNIQTTTRYLQQVNRDNNKSEYNVANAIFG